jgi:hypothetical protein
MGDKTACVLYRHFVPADVSCESISHVETDYIKCDTQRINGNLWLRYDLGTSAGVRVQQRISRLPTVLNEKDLRSERKVQQQPTESVLDTSI